MESENQRKAQESLRRNQIFQNFLSLAILGFIIWGLIAWWMGRDDPRIHSLTLSNTEIAGPADVCVGDFLLVKFNLHIEGEGLLVRNESLQKADPPTTLIFSQPLYFPLRGPVDEVVTIAWLVPETYYDYRSGMVSTITPGTYYRNITISSMGRNALTGFVSIPFNVLEDCNG
jgi:hypothetical protein